MSLDRFVDAQSGGEFEAALAEIRSDRKSGHWIWYVFPQLAGLGTSDTSIRYGIRSLDEAVDYLRHPVLGQRLAQIAEAVATQARSGIALQRLMGSQIDTLKLVSCLTLFEGAARVDAPSSKVSATIGVAANDILSLASLQGFARCARTTAILAGAYGSETL